MTRLNKRQGLTFKIGSKLLTVFNSIISFNTKVSSDLKAVL